MLGALSAARRISGTLGWRDIRRAIWAGRRRPEGGLFAPAGIGLASFVRIERNAENPLIDVAVFR
jgi:hypothetical protein